MPICTYYSDRELQHSLTTSDNEINELVESVRKIDSRYFIREFVNTEHRLFKKPREIKKYSVLYRTFGDEVQVVNFYRPVGSRIYTEVSADIAAAYLKGILNMKQLANQRRGL